MRQQGLHLDQAPPLHLPFRFFLTAPLFGAGAGILLAWYGASALTTPWAPQTLVLTHFITLGFITMVMSGALYQITPVLIGSPVPQVAWARFTHAGLCVGIPALAGGLLIPSSTLLGVALATLLPTFLLFLAQLTWAIFRTRSRNTTVLSVALALTALTVAVALGLFFLWQHAFGWLTGDRWTLTVVHVYLTLGGWVGGLITGVGQVVIPMFYLSGSFPKLQARVVLAALMLVLVSGVGTAWWAPTLSWHLLPLGFAAVAVAVFCLTAAKLLRGRRRKITDITLRFWGMGILSLPVSLAALAAYLILGEPRWLVVFGVLYLPIFTVTITIGMLYKIVPFLIWMHRYSHMAGKADVPLMRDIIPPKHSKIQWWCHLTMTGLLIAAVLTTAVFTTEVPILGDVLVRMAGGALVVSYGGLFIILLRAFVIRPSIEKTPAD